MKTKRLSCLLFTLLALPACDAGPDVELDPDEALDEDALDEEFLDGDASREEIEGGRGPAKTFGRVDNSDRVAEVDQIRAESLNGDEVGRDTLTDLALPRARGLDEPRYRIEEDQDAAAAEFAPTDDEDIRAPARSAVLTDAQQRYLNEKDDLEPAARAARKEALLGE